MSEKVAEEEKEFAECQTCILSHVWVANMQSLVPYAAQTFVFLSSCIFCLGGIIWSQAVSNLMINQYRHAFSINGGRSLEDHFKWKRPWETLGLVILFLFLILPFMMWLYAFTPFGLTRRRQYMARLCAY